MKKAIGIIFLAVAVIMVIKDCVKISPDNGNSSEKLSKTEYLNQCKECDYKEYASHPELYKHKKLIVNGTVESIYGKDGKIICVVNVNGENVVNVSLSAGNAVLTNSDATFYAEYQGIVDGIPTFAAAYAEYNLNK